MAKKPYNVAVLWTQVGVNIGALSFASDPTTFANVRLKNAWIIDVISEARQNIGALCTDTCVYIYIYIYIHIYRIYICLSKLLAARSRKA